MLPEILIISLLVVVSAVAVAARYLRVPYTVILVLTGLLVGAVLRNTPFLGSDVALRQTELTPYLVFSLLLPALLFEATLHVEVRTLKQTLAPIALLAIPGVILTALIVGLLIHFGIGIDWQTSLLFGALIAATDPVAVLSIFRRIGAPRELELLIEGESIFNDGTAVVLANVIKGAILAGTFSLLGGGLEFLLVVGGGIIVGLITGTIIVRLLSRLDDHFIEITLTMILTYGTFLIAESVHVSGIIAVVAAGLVLANVAARNQMSPTTMLALLNFWEYIAFLINSIIFLLIGLQINLIELLQKPLPLVIAIAAVLLARAIVVYGLGLTVLPFVKRLPPNWLHAVFWAGPRGAVSLAVVLALPVALPERGFLIDLTFGVVLFTLLVQTLTMERLLFWLGIKGTDAQYQMYLTRRAQRLMLAASERALDQLKRESVVSPKVYEQLRANYRIAAAQLDAELEYYYRIRETLVAEETRETRKHLLRVERTTLIDLRRTGMIDTQASQKLLEAIDARLIALDDLDDAAILEESALVEFDPTLTGEEGTLAAPTQSHP